MSILESLKGTKTESNLRAAFSGESQARNRYTYWSEIAQNEGYAGIAKLFDSMARNEMAHAKAWYLLLNNNTLPDTKGSLIKAMEGERFESHDMYPAFAKIAKEEGFDEIAELFHGIGVIEKNHEEQCRAVLESLANGKVLEYHYPDTSCLNCGHEFNYEDNKDICPICKSSYAFFIQSKNAIN